MNHACAAAEASRCEYADVEMLASATAGAAPPLSFNLCSTEHKERMQPERKQPNEVESLLNDKQCHVPNFTRQID